MTTDHSGSDEPEQEKAGRHRRARRPRLTVEQVDTGLKVADAFARLVRLMSGEHETPLSEWFHSLAGPAMKILDVIGSWLG